MSAEKIPVTVLVMTRNEASRIGRCLEALREFDEIVVVDSGSTDDTAVIAESAGATVEHFSWNGRYPKKRQWCLDNLNLKHDWIFFVDADEIVTPELAAEIRTVIQSPACIAYFIKGRYVMDGKILHHGLCNNKIALLDRRAMEFPVVDDLDLLGMGEIEGHYQPVPKPDVICDDIGSLSAALLHHAHDDPAAWEARHHRYAAWERGMNARNAWPADPLPWRQTMKRIFRALPGRGIWAFLHCYVWKRGFFDGKQGLTLAASRYRYYRMIVTGSK